MNKLEYELNNASNTTKTTSTTTATTAITNHNALKYNSKSSIPSPLANETASVFSTSTSSTSAATHHPPSKCKTLNVEDLSFGDFTQDELEHYLNKPVAVTSLSSSSSSPAASKLSLLQNNSKKSESNKSNKRNSTDSNGNKSTSSSSPSYSSSSSSSSTPSSYAAHSFVSDSNGCYHHLNGIEFASFHSDAQSTTTAAAAAAAATAPSAQGSVNFDYPFTILNNKSSNYSATSSPSSSFSSSSSSSSSSSTTSSETMDNSSSSSSTNGIHIDESSQHQHQQQQQQKQQQLNSSLNSSSSSSSEQQRRNKKKKPASYYQSAEYAAVIKDADALLQSVINSSSSTAPSTTSTSSVTQSAQPVPPPSSQSASSSSSTNNSNTDAAAAAAATAPSLSHPQQSLPTSVLDNDNNETSTSPAATTATADQTEQPAPSATTSTAAVTESANIEPIEQAIESISISADTETKPNVVHDNTPPSPQAATQPPTTTQSDANPSTVSSSTSTAAPTVNSAPAPAPPASTASSSGGVWGSNGSSGGGSLWSNLFKAASTSSSSAAVSKTPAYVNGKQQAGLTSSMLPLASSTTSGAGGNSSSSLSVSSSGSSHAHQNGHHHSTDSTVNNNNNNSQSHSTLKTLGAIFKNCDLKHSAPALQPRGIRNRQNWCYVNATLQALLACPPLYNLIRQVYIKIKSSNLNAKSVPCLNALGRFANEFKVMVRPTAAAGSSPSPLDAQSASVTKYATLVTPLGKELVIGEPFDIDAFYSTLAELCASNDGAGGHGAAGAADTSASAAASMTFKSGRQEDAQEFLSFLLNRLHEEMIMCLESQNPPPPLAPSSSSSKHHQTSTDANKAHNGTNGGGVEIDEDTDEWKEVGKKNRAFITRKTEFKQSPLSDIFCGQFRTALSQTGYKDKESVSLEPFFTLPLDIQHDSIRTVQQALDHFVQKEEVFGFTNQETKQEIEAFKRISFEDLPPVLILYLKCFVYDKQGGIQKLLKRIEFVIDLEINKELISPNQRAKLREKKKSYKLFAVEYHHGEKATGGHYITDVYHPGIVGWVRYDDANVTLVTNYNLLKSDDRKLTPYLLYYRRADLI